MNGFIKFMSSTNGRIARGVAGVAIIALGLLTQTAPTSYIIAAVGAVPLLAGVFDLCLFAPLAGLPLNGAKVRALK